MMRSALYEERELEVRLAGSVALAVLNDQTKQVSEGGTEALKEYEIEPVKWSEREQIRERLVA